jgi:hypothetical protein
LATTPTALEQRGVRVVEETAVRVATAAGPIWVAGISDLWTGRPDVPAALAAVTDDAPVILLYIIPTCFLTCRLESPSPWCR